MSEDRDWQRLDKWMWCARFLKARSDCARLVGEGSVRVNRQATDKPHAKIRPGDVLTVPLRGDVMVVRVLGLAGRRGPAVEARELYEVMLGDEAVHTSPAPGAPSKGGGKGCVMGETTAYPALRLGS